MTSVQEAITLYTCIYVGDNLVVNEVWKEKIIYFKFNRFFYSYVLYAL
jgi:hypothetical protein